MAKTQAVTFDNEEIFVKAEGADNHLTLYFGTNGEVDGVWNTRNVFAWQIQVFNHELQTCQGKISCD